MDDRITELLFQAHDAVHQAQQRLYTQHRAGSITIPDLYPVMANLVEMARALCEFLESIPDPTGFDPSEHYDTEGRAPQESMASAEYELHKARMFADALDPVLNMVWSDIGRLGLKDVQQGPRPEPDAILKKMRNAVKEFDAAKDRKEDVDIRNDFLFFHAIAVITAFEALDNVLSEGGSLPQDWKQSR